MGKIKVAIIGVGNCASSLVQGIHKYVEVPDDDPIPGVMHNRVGDYRIEDIEVVAAFDVDRNKVGKDLSEAIFTEPNNTIKFAEVPYLGVPVERGMTHDGIGRYLSDLVVKSEHSTADISGILREREVDVVINYLPVGSEMATKWYVEQILDARCAMINCIPVFIAREEYWRNRFEERGVPIIGDDIKSQVGATIVHRVLTRLMENRGAEIDNTYQLNFGGNTDFLNMLERERLVSKKISKTGSVTSQMEEEPDADTIHIGPSDHVPWLQDRKWCYIHIDGKVFRRRSGENGGQAGGLGQPQLRRRRGGRHPVRQAGAGPRPGRRGVRAFRLLYEEPASAIHGLRSARHGGGVHRRAGGGRRAGQARRRRRIAGATSLPSRSRVD